MADFSRLPGPNADLWDWQLHAACRGVDSSLFFHPEGERGAARSARENSAKEVCMRCPVRAECAAHALAVREPYGVWGGLTEDEREELMGRARHRLVSVSNGANGSGGHERHGRHETNGRPRHDDDRHLGRHGYAEQHGYAERNGYAEQDRHADQHGYSEHHGYADTLDSVDDSEFAADYAAYADRLEDHDFDPNS
jgi:WhiB family redox-sensing transcriptional regulator